MAQFQKYREYGSRPPRDLESLRMKFDKLDNVKKPIGDPSSPPRIRRAKKIAREILGTVNAISVGGDEDCVEEALIADGHSGENRSSAASLPPSSLGSKRAADGSALGARSGKMRAGATGIVRIDVDKELIEHMGDISRAIHKLVDTSTTSSSALTLTMEDVSAILKQDVQTELLSFN